MQTIIDLEFGLKQLSGNKTLLLRMFGKFRDEYEGVSERLETLLQDGEYTTAQHMVHTIKGVAGNLGMTHLHHSSRELEAFIKELQPDMWTALKSFSSSLQATLDEISRLEQEDAPEPSPATSATDANSETSKDELIGILQRNEFLPTDKLNSIVANLGLSQPQQEQLQELIGDLDYPKAIALLQNAD